MSRSRKSDRTIPFTEPKTRSRAVNGKGKSACADEPIVRSDDPAATLTRNRLNAAHARHKVSAGYANHALRTLQDRRAIDDLTNDPVGDPSRVTEALNVQCRRGGRRWRFN